MNVSKVSKADCSIDAPPVIRNLIVIRLIIAAGFGVEPTDSAPLQNTGRKPTAAF
jgi:hypothetical protein